METTEAKHIHAEIVARCQKGEMRAFHQLYQLYSKAMFNICLRMMNSREEAEDLLQDAFSSAFKNIKRYRQESSFGSWLKQIVLNKCINELKRKQIELSEMNDERLPDEPDDDIHSIDEEQIQFSVSAIKQAMKQLSDGYRAVLTLYLFEGYDHREIAEIMGITESTSKSQFNRAKSRLRQLLKEEGYERFN